MKLIELDHDDSVQSVQYWTIIKYWKYFIIHSDHFQIESLFKWTMIISQIEFKKRREKERERDRDRNHSEEVKSVPFVEWFEDGNQLSTKRCAGVDWSRRHGTWSTAVYWLKWHGFLFQFSLPRVALEQIENTLHMVKINMVTRKIDGRRYRSLLQASFYHSFELTRILRVWD